jgi:hypothetical protein
MIVENIPQLSLSNTLERTIVVINPIKSEKLVAV